MSVVYHKPELSTLSPIISSVKRLQVHSSLLISRPELGSQQQTDYNPILW
jgi:hypothetical protein